jgi:hypothetical protein
MSWTLDRMPDRTGRTSWSPAPRRAWGSRAPSCRPGQPGALLGARDAGRGKRACEQANHLGHER